MTTALRILLATACLCSLRTFSGEADGSLKQKGERVEELLSAFVPASGPGAAILVIQDGKKIYEKCHGDANIAEKIPITPETNFELASDSKQFTAMAIMMLKEEGKLEYSDHLSKFLPEFKDVGREITIAHLLHHTAGLKDYFDVWDKHGKGEITARRVMELLAKQDKLRFAPGEKYEYSNSGYMVLAQVIEKVSGKRYAEFLREKIFAPLKMEDSEVFDETHPKIKHGAACYKHTREGWEKIKHDDWDNVYGDGSIRSTLNDLYKWDQALYTEKLIKASTLETAFTSGKLNDGSDTGYGFGWEIDTYHRATVVSHSGEWLGYENFIYRIPEWNFTVIFLSNGSFAKQSDKLIGEVVRVFYPKGKGKE